MHWLHIITQIFREQEMQTNINTSNIKISTLNSTIFISPTTDQRDKPTVQYGSKIECKKRHLVKSITSWSYYRVFVGKGQHTMVMLQISSSFFVKMLSIQHSSLAMSQSYQEPNY